MDAVQNRVTIAEAARRLGLSDDAIRKRVKTGKLGGYRVGSKWYVLLEDVQNEVQNEHDGAASTTLGVQNEVQNDPTALIAALQKHVQFLQSELERKDAILLRLVEQRPALPRPDVARATSDGEPPMKRFIGDGEPLATCVARDTTWWLRWAGWRR